MTQQQTEPAAGPAGNPSMRDRIVEAAAELFYGRGIRAVSAEKIIAKVGITKVTFYRYFRTKDDLIVAYLERRAKWERDAIAGARQAAGGQVPEVFRLVAEGIGAESCSPGFRGCPFINAAAEYADADHPVRHTVDRHRKWFKQAIEEMLTEIGVRDTSAAADELIMLRDGAMVGGYLGNPATIARSLYAAGKAVIEHHRSTEGQDG
ncbi:TetR/AcrR family transcriptional regulator [Amycolatopsis rhabdoformis]|uniref:TetR/AcrR family transcriptional regulator n=1 Tax=Amycolatopsis rhabdoformis TaxID=1448059 RepID=A0ABZ1I8P6_9PSEU|nr:TetR/AcrR family transcriptional regulator [Amycolatopsis rhabdoformis]WSE29948.1 TetR/AcrR family transcriptional regulator [Amycolatopsis rhabdoformis]